LRIGFYQFSPAFGDIEKNLEMLRGRLNGELPHILVLPELAFTGYNFINREEAVKYAEEIPGPLFEEIRNLSKEKQVAISTGFLERVGDNIYNSSVFVSPEGDYYVYRKVHLFYKEKEIFSPGDGFFVFEYRGVKIGMLICFDWIFPEAMRTLTLMGAEVILHHANLVLPFCQDAMITRSIENRVFIVTANRTGVEDRGGERYVFTGRSQVVAPGGKLLLRVGDEVTGVFSVDIDPYIAGDKSINRFNHLIRDRRQDIYRC